MAISQLNTVFAKHHRIIFGVFSIIIIIAFTDFLTPGTGIIDAFRGTGAGQAAGEVFGRKISYAELNDQMRLDMLTLQFLQGRQVDSSMREMLETESLCNLGYLEAARRADIAVSNDEVKNMLRVLFAGQDGKFSLQIYKNFVTNILPQQGFTEEDLTAAIKQYLTINKLQELQSASVTVTPGDLQMIFNMQNEEFEVIACEINAKDFNKSVKVDAKALDAFFQSRRNQYVIPAQLQALAVEYPYNKYRSAAIKLVKDPQLKAFYEQNKQLFATVKDGKMIIPELDKVKDQVRSSAIAAAARQMAVEEAQKFSVAAYEELNKVPAEKRLATFKKLLADKKLNAKATGKFTSDSKTAGTIAEGALVKELLSVMDMPLTNAVAGSNAAYVAFATEFVPSRNAEFKEVQAQVTADFINAESYKAAEMRAAEIAAKLNAIQPSARVARAEAMQSPKFKAVGKFTIMSGSPELGFAAVEVLNLQPGEIAKPFRKATGVQLLMLKSRKNSNKEFKTDPMLEMMCRQYKTSIQMMAFRTYIGNNCKKYAQSAENQAVAE